MGTRTKRPKPPAEPTPAQVLGQVVRSQRRALGLTQEALCLHAGVGLAFLYELEAGKPTVRLDKVLAVLKVLGVRLTLALGNPDFPGGTVHSTLGAPR